MDRGTTIRRPTFKQLNQGWNAEPNTPNPEVTVHGSEVQLSFFLNPFALHAEPCERGRITFADCSRWRLGSTNDEGWHRGQCRYSRVAPKWGEFYELVGEDNLLPEPSDWREAASPSTGRRRHFLFYLRDQTFECFAGEWTFDRGEIRIEDC